MKSIIQCILISVLLLITRYCILHFLCPFHKILWKTEKGERGRKRKERLYPWERNWLSEDIVKGLAIEWNIKSYIILHARVSTTVFLTVYVNELDYLCLKQVIKQMVVSNGKIVATLRDKQELTKGKSSHINIPSIWSKKLVDGNIVCWQFLRVHRLRKNMCCLRMQWDGIRFPSH